MFGGKSPILCAMTFGLRVRIGVCHGHPNGYKNLKLGVHYLFCMLNIFAMRPIMSVG